MFNLRAFINRCEASAGTNPGIGAFLSQAFSSAGTIGRAVATGLAGGAVVALAALSAGTAAAELRCPVGKRVDGVCLSVGLHTNLPVVSDGQRFMSQPYGDSRTILDVAHAVRRNGMPKYERVPALRIAGRVPLQTTDRYDYQFPQVCGGYRFSYFETRDLKALGLQRGEQLIVDVLKGGGTFSAPRLWGVNDQVLDETTPMKLIAGDAREGGVGTLGASYAVGFVAMLPEEKLREYGRDYATATRQAKQCLEALGSGLASAK
jgi:hypothetical protein